MNIGIIKIVFLLLLSTYVITMDPKESAENTKFKMFSLIKETLSMKSSNGNNFDSVLENHGNFRPKTKEKFLDLKNMDFSEISDEEHESIIEQIISLMTEKSKYISKNNFTNISKEIISNLKQAFLSKLSTISTTGFLQSNIKDLITSLLESLKRSSIKNDLKTLLKSQILQFLRDRANAEYSNKTNTKVLPSDVKDSFLCKPCHWVVGHFDKFAEKKYGFNFFKKVLTGICSIILDYEVCSQAIERYGDTIFDSILDHYLDSEYICTLLQVCPNHFVELNPDDFAKEVLKDKPKKVDPPSYPSKTMIKVMHLSDMHIDPNYKEGSEADCGKPFCCNEKNNPVTTEIKKPAGFWGTLAQCDLPLRTLESMMATIAAEIKPDLILWTGDNGSHDIWKVSEDLASKATHNVGNILKANLTSILDIPVFPAIGNHEERDVDEFNFFNVTFEQDLLKNISEVYSMFITPEQTQEFLHQGFFSAKYKDSKLRVISLNCFLCDAINFYSMRNPTDPLNQIEFLRKTLQSAEDNGEVVFIIGHIPPGDDEFPPECNYRYNALVDRYQNIIRGQFFGHTHNDEVRTVKSYFDKTKRVGAIYIVPSTTTYSYLNPSFRVFEVDPESFFIKNYRQYRLNLTEANLHPDQVPKWHQVYDFNSFYEVENPYDFDGIDKSLTKITEADNVYYHKFLKTFYSDGPLYDKNLNNKIMKTSLYCKLITDNFDDMMKCCDYVYYNEEYIGSLIVNFISGKWFIKKNDKLILDHN